MRIERIDSPDALRALRSEWQRLAEAHGDGLPFRTWEWHDAWWRHFREDRFQVRDALRISAVRAESGELAGIAPMMLTRRPCVGALGVRVLDFVGADHNVTELRGVLCQPRWEVEVHRALLLDAAERAGEWDWICWRGVRAGSPAEGVLAAHPDVRAVEETPNWVLPLSAPWQEFRARRPRNLKESLRKCYNSLRRDGHRFRLDVARDPADVRAALDHFFRLHGARAALQGTVAHPDVFASPASRAFLLDVCDQLAARDAVRVFQLRIGGEVVASRVGFTGGGSLYLYYSGYDPRWSRYGVMTTALAEAIKYAIDEGFRSVNLSTGTDVSKTRWRPEQVTYRGLVHSSRSLRGRLAHLAYRWARDGLGHPRLRGVAVRLFGRRARA